MFYRKEVKMIHWSWIIPSILLGILIGAIKEFYDLRKIREARKSNPPQE